MTVLADGLDFGSIKLLLTVAHEMNRIAQGDRKDTDGVPLMLKTLSWVSSKLM